MCSSAQLAGEMLSFVTSPVNINVKTKIRYNGREYSSPDELPPEVRAAYEKAITDGEIKRRIVLNGQEFESENEMPGDERRLYDDVMSVIENNGEVTLPRNGNMEPLLTKRQLLFVVLFGLGIASLILARLIR